MSLPTAPNLITPPPEPRREVSVLLDELVSDHPNTDISLAEVVAKLGDRTFGLLLLVFAIYNLLPAINMLFGPLTALLGLQLLVGIERPWLPRRVLALEIPVATTDAVINRLLPRLKGLERFIKPRWHWTEAPLVDNLLGLIVTCMGLIIAVPVPLSNGFPAIVVGVIGFGLAARDGVLQCIGFVVGCFTVVLMSGLIVGFFQQLSRWLSG